LIMHPIVLETPLPSASRRIGQLLLLAVAAWAATYARMILGPLQEAVKTSLTLSDHQIALLQGMGLALPLALGSIPLGLLADRAPRSRMLIFCLGLGLGASMLAVFAADFTMLMIARGLTGVAVAGVLVAAYSMAGDLFAPTERGRATMVMGIGEVGGAPAAFALGGVLLTSAASTFWPLEAWRGSLLWMSAVLVPTLLCMMLLREPLRSARVESPPLRTIWSLLWSYRSVAVPLQLARATLFIADGAVFVWGAPFLARTYHLPADRVGASIGLVLLAGGLLGPALGGPLVDYCQRRGGPRRAVTMMGMVALLSIPAALFALMPSASGASVMLAVLLILGFTIAAAALALTIIVIPSEVRGVNLGISIVIGSLFFIGLAPLAVSAMSAALGGESNLGKALAIVCASMSLLNAAVLLFSRRYFSGQNNEAPRVRAS
jgi:predicted MFS family arabinose efflux permease